MQFVSTTLFARDVEPGDILRGDVVDAKTLTKYGVLFFNDNKEVIHHSDHYLDTLNIEKRI